MQIHHFLVAHVAHRFPALQDDLRKTIKALRDQLQHLVVSIEGFGLTQETREKAVAYINSLLYLDDETWKKQYELLYAEDPWATLVIQEVRNQMENFQSVRLNLIGPNDNSQQSYVLKEEEVNRREISLRTAMVKDIDLKHHKQEIINNLKETIEKIAKVMQISNKAMIEQLQSLASTSSNNTLNIAITGANHIGVSHEVKTTKHVIYLPELFLDMLPNIPFDFYNSNFIDRLVIKKSAGREITELDLKRSFLSYMLTQYLSQGRKRYKGNFPQDKLFLDSPEVISLLSSAWILRTDKEKINELFDKCFELRPNSEDRPVYYLGLYTIGDLLEAEVMPHNEPSELADLLYLMFNKLTAQFK